MPGDYYDNPGPDPSSLETRDHLPEGVPPINLRITYTDSKLTDYVALNRSGRQVCIELCPSLFDIVRKAGKVRDLKNELKEAMAAIGIGGIVTHFVDTVMEYAREILPSFSIPEMTGLAAAAYLLKKLWDRGTLMLGIIHHASIDELPSWMGMIKEAKKNPDITVNSGDPVT